MFFRPFPAVPGPRSVRSSELCLERPFCGALGIRRAHVRIANRVGVRDLRPGAGVDEVCGGRADSADGRTHMKAGAKARKPSYRPSRPSPLPLQLPSRIQDTELHVYNAVMWEPPPCERYIMRHARHRICSSNLALPQSFCANLCRPRRPRALKIYEAHVGTAGGDAAPHTPAPESRRRSTRRRWQRHGKAFASHTDARPLPPLLPSVVAVRYLEFKARGGGPGRVSRGLESRRSSQVCSALLRTAPHCSTAPAVKKRAKK